MEWLLQFMVEELETLVGGRKNRAAGSEIVIYEEPEPDFKF
jgi:hypothetical protein